MNAAAASTKPTNMRWIVSIMMFLIAFVSYMDRVNLSVAVPMIMKEFRFTKIEIGLMQTAFFTGYAIMQIPGGLLAERFGHRRVAAFGVAWWSAFTALTAAGFSLFSFVLIRGLFGLGEGPVFPAFGSCLYHWYSKFERGRSSAILMSGGFLGPVVGPALTVSLMLAFGWRWVFILFGLAGLVMASVWYVFVTQTPKENKYVNEAELRIIAGDEFAAAGGAPAEKKGKVAPWSKFMGSTQFWAIAVEFFVTDYIMYVFLAWLPLYLMEAQKFSLRNMGIAASFPWLALCIATLMTGWIADKIVVAGMSKFTARTLFGSLGLVICCVTLYLGAVATVPWQNVMWMSFSLGALGLTFNASWAACLDLGGKYSGSVSGWMNLWGNIGGMLAPILTAWIATKYSWRAAIIVTAAAAFVGVLAWFLVKPDKCLVVDEVPGKPVLA
jgi:ACS family glucarate transporter-like MFS transporter